MSHTDLHKQLFEWENELGSLRCLRAIYVVDDSLSDSQDVQKRLKSLEDNISWAKRQILDKKHEH